MESLDPQVADANREIVLRSSAGTPFTVNAAYIGISDTIKNALDMDPILKEFAIDKSVGITDNALKLAIKYMNHHQGKVIQYVPFVDVKVEFDPDNEAATTNVTEKRTCCTRWTHPGHYFKYRTDLHMEPGKNRVFDIKDIFSWDAYFISHVGPTLRILYDLGHCAHYLGINSLLQLFAIHVACVHKGLEADPEPGTEQSGVQYMRDYMSQGVDIPVRRFSGNIDFDLDLIWPKPDDFIIDETTYMYEEEATFKAEVARRESLKQT